jgi:hypothetical protein
MRVEKVKMGWLIRRGSVTGTAEGKKVVIAPNRPPEIG